MKVPDKIVPGWFVCDECGNDHPADQPCPSQEAGPADAAPSSAAAALGRTGRGGSALDAAAPDAASDPLVGQKVGNFRIARRLGSGGMGTVYLGEHETIGSKVAVKFLHEHLAADASVVKRFHAEARAVNLITHDNIVRVYDIGMLPPNRHFLTMEYLEGAPLSTLHTFPMPPLDAVHLLSQACQALDVAHAHGVIHRDLKPENIFVITRRDGTRLVKIVDFGVAKMLSGAVTTTASGAMIGTPAFMCPELWTGKDVDGRADIYALGVMAYLMLTGRLPFNETTVIGFFQAHVNRQPAPMQRIDVPPALEAAVLRALAKKPEERFGSAAAMRLALEAAVRGSTARPVEPISRNTPAPTAVFRPTPTPAPRTMSTPAPRTMSTPAPRTMSTPAPTTMHTPAPRTQGMPTPSPQPARPAAQTRPPTQAMIQAPLPPKTTSVSQRALAAMLPGQAKWRGQAEGRPVAATELTKGGCFLMLAEPLPPMFEKVNVTVESDGVPLELSGEVVRHVSTAQAQQWNLAAGVAVQFSGLSPENKERLEKLLRGEAPIVAARKAPEAPKHDDPEADVLLSLYEGEKEAYELLGLKKDCECEDAKDKARALTRKLSVLKDRPLSEGQKLRLDTALERVGKAAELLSTPAKRAPYDAESGNFAGVARSLAAGLKVSELEPMRREYLIRLPALGGKSYMHTVAAQAFEKNHQEREALGEYETALTVDPLNVQLHHKYWALYKKLNGNNRR